MAGISSFRTSQSCSPQPIVLVLERGSVQINFLPSCKKEFKVELEPQLTYVFVTILLTFFAVLHTR